ncbi:hypothetical protein CFAM422_009936 [Trichoderma lentiforme]|uniref:Uncharacterized protein n=1 Tax=Trichoderma lentiforme TaxID=1567552 RepID=A0A9P4X8I3_9HYPO|nr:hypothetical protein CFAM422_009936 [Trichoderma lentiforme]
MINLGDAPIHIRRQSYVGQLRPVQLTTDIETYLADERSGIALTDLLGADQPDEVGEDPKHEDGYPFHVTPQDTSTVGLDTADIADTWDAEQMQRILAVLYKHRRLFRPGPHEIGVLIHYQIKNPVHFS